LCPKPFDMTSKQKTLVWVLLTVIIFSLFRWLTGLAMPEIATPFSIGITVVLIAGLFSGYQANKIWFRELEQSQNTLVVILIVGMLMTFVGIGVLVNKMIVKTEFMEFSLTVLLLFILNFCIGTFTGIVRNRIKSRIQKARTELAHSKSELQLLQSQLSPHFLFNTLNNVYGLSLTNHEKVPVLLLKLSELLRYSVYDAKEIFVQLTQELDYIKNYIDFEKLRLGNRLDLKMNFEGVTDESVKIPPMLLIVFVENAFKHSRDTQGDKILINITLRNTKDEIVFSVMNSCFRTDSHSTSKEKHSGFGLDSVRRRLNLLYEHRHELAIRESLHDYVVNLRLMK
jgi:sensor histidine kinase YesM